MTTITPSHNPRRCRQATENRRQLLSEIYDCLTSLDACDRLAEAEAGGRRFGRTPQRPLPSIVYPEYPRRGEYCIPLPEKTPPWMLPRVASRELLGGDLKIGCDCTKRNGLQDDCPRLPCRGQPACKTRPEPYCYPSFT